MNNLKNRICCIAYSNFDFTRADKYVTFCGKVKAGHEVAINPNNSDCLECRRKITELVGTDFSQLESAEIIKKILEIEPK